MNALWLTRISAYKTTPLALASAKRLIALKIERQSDLLKRYKKGEIGSEIEKAGDLQTVFLEEARAAKHFWREFKQLLPEYAAFPGRAPHAPDVTNRLLDLGYHHLTGIVRKLLEAHDVPAALSLLHVARESNSAPLAYDLVELFRSDIVDAEVLRFLHLKKKPITSIEGEAAHFLHEVNERLERKHYLSSFHACQTYRYYMELQILKFIKAVNHEEVFEPLHLPTRHDTRCLTRLQPVVPSATDKVFDIG